MQADMLELEALQSSKQSQLVLFQEEKARLEEDEDVPLRLKQGQVEVQPQGLVDSSLDHAVLVSQQLVQVGFLWSPPLALASFPPLHTLLTYPLSLLLCSPFALSLPLLTFPLSLHLPVSSLLSE